METIKFVSKLPQYKIWANMMRRCYNPCEHHKKYYSGIKVCDHWHNSKVFCMRASKNGYKSGLSLDRIDINKDYTPENCRFVTLGLQKKENKRNLSRLTINNKTQTITKWAREYGIRENTIRMRLKYGHIGLALVLPTKKYGKHNNFWSKKGGGCH